MALDFAIINQNNEPIKSVPIWIESHGRIFYRMPGSKYPILERLREYYEDSIFEQTEFETLIAELVSLKELHFQNEVDIKLLDSMISLINEAAKLKMDIEAIAD